MIFFLLLIDLFFYNYTSIATYSFLLIFFYKKRSLLYILLSGLIWDFLLLHTNGYFTLLLFLLFVINKKLKAVDQISLLIKFIVIHLVYYLFVWLVFHQTASYLFGVIFNLLALFLGNQFYKTYI